MPTEQELKKAYEHAPAHVKEVLTSPETGKMVAHIAQKNELDDIHAELLLNEVGLVLLGLEEKTSFADNLKEVLELSEPRAKTVAVQIDGAIFSKVETGASQPAEASVQPQKQIVVEQNIPIKSAVAPGPRAETSPVMPQQESDIAEQNIMRQMLREHGKTVNIRNIIENL